jgi:hypothetical protein
MFRAPAVLIVLALMAEVAAGAPLAPGKPAGVGAAQHISYRTGFIGLTIIAVALTFGLPASSTSSTATSAATTS